MTWMEMDEEDFWTGYNLSKKKFIHSLDQFENQINEINDLREYDAEGWMSYMEWISRKYSGMKDDRMNERASEQNRERRKWVYNHSVELKDANLPLLIHLKMRN